MRSTWEKAQALLTKLFAGKGSSETPLIATHPIQDELVKPLARAREKSQGGAVDIIKERSHPTWESVRTDERLPAEYPAIRHSSGKG
jgi:hypothetical protein